MTLISNANTRGCMVPRATRVSFWMPLAALVIAGRLSGQGQADIEYSFVSGNTNTITLQTESGSADVWLIYDSPAVFIDDRVQVVYPAAYTIESGALPDGWAFQDGVKNDSERAATWWFEGSSSSGSAEFYNLADELTLTFDVHGAESGSNVLVDLQVKASVVIGGSFPVAAGFIRETYEVDLFVAPLVRFREEYGLAEDGSEDASDASGNGISNLQVYAFGLGNPGVSMVDRSFLPRVGKQSIKNGTELSFVRRRDQDDDGIAYLLEESSSMETGQWDEIERIPDEVSVIDENYERVFYRFEESGAQLFYRVGIRKDE